MSLRHKKYCILNKQYEKEEYFALRKRIVEHMKKNSEWGEFFPKSSSCFAYNESTVNEYFPLSKEEALAKGFQWREASQKEYQAQAYVIPDRIQDVPPSIVNELLACAGCGKNYRIVSQELSFYHTMNIPIPRKCSDCRHFFRMSLRNLKHLWQRNCAQCGVVLESTYAPERPERVVCEKCYRKEVFFLNSRVPVILFVMLKNTIHS